MKVTKFLFSILLIAGIIFSCGREDNGAINEEKTTHYLQREVISPDYSGNYLDSVGVIHNEILTKVIQSKRLLSTQDDYINYSRKTFETDYNFPAHTFSTLSNSDVKHILDDKDNSYYHTIQNTGLSVEAKQYLTDLVSLLEMLSEEDENQLEYSFVKNKITYFEDYVLSDGNLNANEKNIILAVTSVARYSSFFWYNEYLLYFNLINSGLVPVTPPYEVTKKWWKWLVVGVADATGTIAGGVA